MKQINNKHVGFWLGDNKDSYDKKNRESRKNNKYLTFEALENNSSISLRKIGTPSAINMKYSLDGGVTWIQYALGTKLYIDKGQTIMFLGTGTSMSANTSSYYQFIIPNRMDVYGNVASLVNFNTYAGSYMFYRLFYNASITRAHDLKVQSNVSSYSYMRMFENCTQLVSAPELPATTVQSYSYYEMFLNCTSLMTAPILPAPKMITTYSYYRMFYGCVSLRSVTVYCMNTFGYNTCFANWLDGTASHGTIYKPSVLDFPSAYIPSGWTVENIPAETVTFQSENEVHRLSNFTGTAKFSSYNKPSFMKIASNGDVSIIGKFTKFNDIFYLVIKRENELNEYRLVEFLYLQNCLKFTATQPNSSVGFGSAGTSKWTVNNTFYYSLDDGRNWIEYENPSNTDYATCQMISLPNVGDSVTFRGTNKNFNENGTTRYMRFKMTGKISASGSIFSLIGFYNGNAPSYSFYHLFENCTSLVKAPEMNSLAVNSYCYRGMFINCTSLTEPPLLIATDIYAYCYANMFQGCTALTKTPILPATIIREGSYYQMFEGCTALTIAPVLPGTTVYGYGYYRMFAGCTALTDARTVIHGTSLSGSYHYKEMFYGCTSLVTAPRLIAGTLAPGCYERMFYGCANLNYVATSATTWRGGSTTEWLEGVSPTGAFRCSNAFLPVITGDNYIPTGWKIQMQNNAEKIEADYLDYLDLTKYLYISATTVNYITMDKVTITSNTLPSGLSLNNGILTGAISEDKQFTVTASTDVNTWEVPVRLRKVSYADSLKFTATEANSKIKFIKSGSPAAITCLYSLDNGTTWNSYAVTTSSAVITLANIGDTVMFRCTTRTLSTNSSHYYRFVMDTGGFNASGHLSSLCNFHDACTVNYQFIQLFNGCTRLHEARIRLHSAMTSYCYQSLFIYCSNLTVTPELYCTQLKSYCYYQMFYGCTLLVNAPELPATTMIDYCYSSLFYGCTSLINAPELPAKILATGCYQQMFYNCSSLTTAPELPVTYLLSNCYLRMFAGCTSLVAAPELPAITMSSLCYSFMFMNCTSLVNTPDLPAVTYSSSHRGIFYNCKNLKSVRVMAYNTFNISNTRIFLFGCANNGKLVLLHPYATPVFSESYGIPSNWYCEDANGKILGIGASPISEIGLLEGETINYQLICGKPDGHTVTFEAVSPPTGVSVSSSGLITGSCPNDESFVVNVLFDGVFQKVSRIFINHATIEDCLKLTNVHTSSSTVRLSKNYFPREVRLQYSLDEGETWGSFVYGTSVTVPKDKSILIRNLDDFFNTEYDVSSYFSMSGNFKASGNISSLVNFSKNINYDFEFTRIFISCTALSSVEDLILPYETLGYYTYYYMFYGCTNITTPPALPATKMGEGCYYGMFINCSKLTRTPEFPALILASSCYLNMFQGCTSLTEVSPLPAKELKPSCYYGMFSGCKALTNAPVLPATTIASSSYQSMFYNCTSLVEPPELPATELNTYCYYQMFDGCSKLARMPELKATVTKNYCYWYMFRNCTSLTETTWMPEDTTNYAHRYMFYGCKNLSLIRSNLKAVSQYNNLEWVKGVAQNGVFVKNPQLVNTFTDYAIPPGWTVKNEVVVGNNNFTQVFGTSSITLNCTCNSSSLVFTSDDIPNALSLNPNGTITNVSAVENMKYTFHVTATPTDTDIAPATFIVYVSYRADILRFKATQDGSSIGFGTHSSTFTTDNHFYYSLDEGLTWTEYMNPSSKKYTACEMISVPNGSTIYIRGITNNLGYADGNCFTFRMTGLFEASGSIMSLINFEEEIPSEYCFARLFYDCTSLVTGPETPATSLMVRCYQNMYYNCSNLTTVSELPAKKLMYYCYYYMFYQCNKLTGITASFDSWTSVNGTYNWVNGITNNFGVFTTKSSTLPITEKGINRIPTNWTAVRKS